MFDVLAARRARLAPFALLALVAPLFCVAPAWAAAGKAAVESRREVVELRSEKSRTSVDPSGVMHTETFLEPVHFKTTGGSWQQIDNRLKRDGAGYVNTAGKVDVRVPDDLSDGARVGVGADWVRFSLADAADTPSVQGTKASYEKVRPGADLEYQALATGLKETLLLDGPAATRRYEFTMRTSAGLEATLGKAGEVRLTDTAGTTRLLVAAPTAWDAKKRFASPSQVTANLEPIAGSSSYRYSVELSEEWLEAKKRAFPVSLDPTVTTPSTSECELSAGGYQSDENFSYCPYSSSSWPIGLDSYDYDVRKRHLARFDVSAVPEGAEVVASSLSLHNYRYTAGPVTDAVSVYPVGRAWTMNASWNRYDGANGWSTAGGDFNTYDPGLNIDNRGDGRRRWDLTSLTQDWVRRDRAGGFGVLLKTSENPPRVCGDDGCSANDQSYFPGAAAADVSQRPRLEIAWEQGVGDKRQYSFDSFELTDRTSASVNRSSGNLLISTSNIALSGTGLDLNLDQIYNSRTERGGVAGPRQTLSLSNDVRLEYRDQTVVFVGPAGERHTFADYGYNSYISPPSIDATMSDRQGGSVGIDLLFNKSGVKYEFSSLGRLESVVDRNSNRIILTRDAGNQRVTGYTDSQGKTVSATYDAQGRIATLRDNATSRTVTYGYDTSGRLTSLTNADGKVTSYDFNAQDQLWRIRTPEGRQTTFDYDAQSRVAHVYQVTDPSSGAQETTTYAYGGSSGCPAGGVGKTTVTDPAARATAYCWDGELRVQNTTDGLGHTSGCTLNSQSNPTTCTDANSRSTSYAYVDAQNDRVKSITDPASTSAGGRGGARTSMTYNAEGENRFLPRTVKDPQGFTQSLDYDSGGNLTSSMSELPSPALGISLEYNPDGTISRSKDGNGNPTGYSYQSKRLSSSTPPPEPGGQPSALGGESYTYDTAARVKSFTDGKAQTRTYTYDPLDRVKTIGYADGTTVSFSYDADGNLTQRVGPTGTTTFAYDRLGRPDSTTYPAAGTVDYAFLGPDLTSITDTAGTVAYEYDQAGRLKATIEPGNQRTTFAYDNANNPTRTSFPNGTVQNTDYDEANRVKRIWATGPAGTLTDLRYSYDTITDDGTVRDTGLLAVLRDELADQQAAYTYDALGRLKSTTWTGTGNLPASQSWGYDGAGNRKQTSPADSATYNNANQLKSTTSTGTINYDANGNRTTGAGLTLAYNAKDQTTSVTPGPLTPVTLSYHSEDQQEAANDGTGTQQPSSLGVIRRGPDAYTRTPDGTLLGLRLGGTQNHYAIRDRLGSIIALTSAGGTISARYTYDSWGTLDTTRSTGLTLINPWRYAGGYEVPTTGLTKFGVRYYDPTQGRWTQPDPLKQIADPRQANAYPYAGDNPINNTDPTGEIAFVIPAAAVGGRIVAGALAKKVIQRGSATIARRPPDFKVGGRGVRVTGRKAPPSRGETKAESTARVPGKIDDLINEGLDLFG